MPVFSIHYTSPVRNHAYTEHLEWVSHLNEEGTLEKFFERFPGAALLSIAEVTPCPIQFE